MLAVVGDDLKHRTSFPKTDAFPVEVAHRFAADVVGDVEDQCRLEEVECGAKKRATTMSKTAEEISSVT